MTYIYRFLWNNALWSGICLGVDQKPYETGVLITKDSQVLNLTIINPQIELLRKILKEQSS
jgi:hypothetical protein